VQSTNCLWEFLWFGGPALRSTLFPPDDRIPRRCLWVHRLSAKVHRRGAQFLFQLALPLNASQSATKFLLSDFQLREIPVRLGAKTLRLFLPDGCFLPRFPAPVNAIARGRRWLDEIVSGSVTDIKQIATRQKCSARQVNMTISLAFLAPDLVRAAVEGRLQRGIGVERLRDAPAEWSQQFEALGLNQAIAQYAHDYRRRSHLS
jgi:hypothetical protein